MEGKVIKSWGGIRGRKRKGLKLQSPGLRTHFLLHSRPFAELSALEAQCDNAL